MEHPTYTTHSHAYRLSAHRVVHATVKLGNVNATMVTRGKRASARRARMIAAAMALANTSKIWQQMLKLVVPMTGITLVAGIISRAADASVTRTGKAMIAALANAHVVMIL